MHPTDDYAREHEHGQLGKTEMWYVLDASKNAKLVYGLSHDVDEPTSRKVICEGTIMKYLQQVPIRMLICFSPQIQIVIVLELQ